MESASGPQCIPLSTMRELLASGIAQPLLESSAPPARVHGQWWAIPEASVADDYVPVDESAAREFDDFAARLALGSGQ